MTTRYEFDIWIDAAPERLFDYFTDPDLFVQWQGSEAEFELRPGGLYRVAYGTMAVISGEFVEIDRPNRLVYMRRLNSVDGPVSRVEIDFVAERGGTRVSVVHTDFAPDEGVEWGWPHFLGQLESLLSALD